MIIIIPYIPLYLVFKEFFCCKLSDVFNILDENLMYFDIFDQLHNIAFF